MTDPAGSNVVDPTRNPFQPPTPTGWLFQPPPGWPELRDPGWQPAPGWRPDPAWPTAPPDWQYWRPGRVISGTAPLTIFGRSPVDSIRLRWGGGGDLLLGFLLLFQGDAAAIVFGLLLMALGIAVWVISRFGMVPFLALATPQRWVVGVGASIGNTFLFIFLGCFIVTLWIIQFFVSSS